MSFYYCLLVIEKCLEKPNCYFLFHNTLNYHQVWTIRSTCVTKVGCSFRICQTLCLNSKIDPETVIFLYHIQVFFEFCNHRKQITIQMIFPWNVIIILLYAKAGIIQYLSLFNFVWVCCSEHCRNSIPQIRMSKKQNTLNCGNEMSEH